MSVEMWTVCRDSPGPGGRYRLAMFHVSSGDDVVDLESLPRKHGLGADNEVKNSAFVHRKKKNSRRKLKVQKCGSHFSF